MYRLQNKRKLYISQYFIRILLNILLLCELFIYKWWRGIGKNIKLTMSMDEKYFFYRSSKRFSQKRIFYIRSYVIRTTGMFSFTSSSSDVQLPMNYLQKEDWKRNTLTFCRSSDRSHVSYRTDGGLIFVIYLPVHRPTCGFLWTFARKESGGTAVLDYLIFS